MKTTFISKTDLAQAYFPYIDFRSARHKLMLIIRDDVQLMQQLMEHGYQDRQHSFSPVQISFIFERLGNPFK